MVAKRSPQGKEENPRMIPKSGYRFSDKIMRKRIAQGETDGGGTRLVEDLDVLQRRLA
jgi:hypothetical protein